VTDGGEVTSAAMAGHAPVKLPAKNRTMKNDLASCIAFLPHRSVRSLRIHSRMKVGQFVILVLFVSKIREKRD
jgi:hypothetical protein